MFVYYLKGLYTLYSYYRYRYTSYYYDTAYRSNIEMPVAVRGVEPRLCKLHVKSRIGIIAYDRMPLKCKLITGLSQRHWQNAPEPASGRVGKS